MRPGPAPRTALGVGNAVIAHGVANPFQEHSGHLVGAVPAIDGNDVRIAPA
jgi:hypothetical protein